MQELPRFRAEVVVLGEEAGPRAMSALRDMQRDNLNLSAWAKGAGR